MKIAVKAMYLIELGKQVLEWQITAPTGITKCMAENKLPLPANDLFARYQESIYPDKKRPEELSDSFPKVRISWTGNKIDLVELIYAWEKAGCFNHGNINIKELVAYIEIVFNIDLGDYYHTFLEMRNRVARTAFLDKLTKFLNERMDEADRKK